tara:strand:+ start:327 stop:551 length:225 start_codon:yes stop_codon:yes gene_type:complete
MWLGILSLEPAIFLKKITFKANKFNRVSVNKCQLNVILKEDLILNLGIFIITAWKRFCLEIPQIQRSFQLHEKG